MESYSNQNQQAISRWLKLSLAGTLSLIIAILIVPVIFHLYTIDDLWQRTFAVLLGGVITTLVTTLLLAQQTSLQQKLQAEQAAQQSRLQEQMMEQQTKKQLEKEKLAKVYEEKLKNYSAFLFKVHNIIEDGVIEPAEVLRLQFDVAQLSMHSDSVSIDKISKSLNEILKEVVSRGADVDEERLHSSLMEMVKIFKEELYGKPEEDEVAEGKEGSSSDSAGNFRTLVELLSKGHGGACPLSLEGELAHADDNLSRVCRQVQVFFRERAALGGWELLPCQPSTGIILQASEAGGDRGRLPWLVSYMLTDSCCVQVHLDLPEEVRNQLYGEMSHYFGGRSHKQGWKLALKEDYKSLLLSPSLSDECRDELARYMADVFARLHEWISCRLSGVPAKQTSP